MPAYRPPQHKLKGRLGLPLRLGGWEWVPIDQSHYGNGAVVAFDNNRRRWLVWDNRHVGGQGAEPDFITWTADQGMECWDAYVRSLREDTEP